mmetsp:Transcript_26131/g.62082  ORF Transcript_26131/g.62082 Transcript_26131/m.62082 type:complete len:90 (-) Transcript_26131:1614-1883(-)
MFSYQDAVCPGSHTKKTLLRGASSSQKVKRRANDERSALGYVRQGKIIPIEICRLSEVAKKTTTRDGSAVICSKTIYPYDTIDHGTMWK